MLQVRSDRIALDATTPELARSRDLKDYVPQRNDSPLPHASLCRGLVSPQALVNLAEAAKKNQIHDAHLRIVKYGLPWQGEDGVRRETFIPCHTTLSLKYDGIPIMGRLFTSIFFALPSWASQRKNPPSFEEKAAMIAYYMGCLFDNPDPTDWQVAVISVPWRDGAAIRPDSPTHHAFCQFAVPHPTTGQKAQIMGKSVNYWFVHAGRPTAIVQTLMDDAKLRDQFQALGNVWSSNFDALCSEPDQPKARDQAFAVLDWLWAAKDEL